MKKIIMMKKKSIIILGDKFCSGPAMILLGMIVIVIPGGIVGMTCLCIMKHPVGRSQLKKETSIIIGLIVLQRPSTHVKHFSSGSHLVNSIGVLFARLGVAIE